MLNFWPCELTRCQDVAVHLKITYCNFYFIWKYGTVKNQRMIRDENWAEFPIEKLGKLTKKLIRNLMWNIESRYKNKKWKFQQFFVEFLTKKLNGFFSFNFITMVQLPLIEYKKMGVCLKRIKGHLPNYLENCGTSVSFKSGQVFTCDWTTGLPYLAPFGQVVN